MIKLIQSISYLLQNELRIYSMHFFPFSHVSRYFLVGAVINKRARLLQSLVFLDRLEAANVNVQLEKLNGYPGNASKLFQRVPFGFLLFKRNLQNRTGLKGPPFRFFSALCDFRNFFVSKESLWFFLLFKRSLQIRMSVKGPPFGFFLTF